MLVVDLLTKLAAVAIFSPGQTIRPLPGLVLGLVYNEANLGTADRAVVAARGHGVLLAWGIGLLLAALSLARFVPRRAPRQARLLAVVGAFLGAWVVGNQLAPFAPLPAVSPAVAVAVRAAGAIAFPLVALRLVPSNWLFLGLALWLAGNLGNGLNVVLSPAGAIDFIHVEALRFRYQMFNVADLALLAGDAVLLTYPLVRVAGRTFGFAS